jgi:hypothetical protein
MTNRDERVGSTYFEQANAALELQSGRGRWANPRPYVTGSEPTASPPLPPPNYSVDMSLEPPFGTSPTETPVNAPLPALGGAAMPPPKPFQCAYGRVGQCLLSDQGNPCVCAEMGQ